MNIRPLVAGAAAAVLVSAGSLGGAYLKDYVTPAHAAPIAAAEQSAAQPPASPQPQGLPDFASIARRYGPAVVNVSVVEDSKSTLKDIPQIQGPFGDFFRHFVPPTPERGLGSGFIISPDGLILTNAHVVKDASEVTVKLTDRREFKAKVVGSDEQSDIAVLRIDAHNLPTVKIGDPSKLQVGDWVLAIGAPYGFENSATAGIVSAKGRSLPDGTYVPFIQTDVAINPGNSGGPLFNLQGQVVGINSQIYSRTGGFQGLAFAIPIDVAMRAEGQLVATGHVERGKLGVTVQEVNQALAKSFGLDRPRGALVASVEDGSPAEKAGVKSGDVIVSFDGHAIDRSSDLPVDVAETKPGTEATLKVWREGGEKELHVKVGSFGNEQVAQADEPAGFHGGRLGVAVRPLTPEERSQAHVTHGLLVEQVDGPAARAGIEQGDVILAVNGTPVTSVGDLRRHIDKAGKNMALLVLRDGSQIFVPVELG